MGHGNEAKPGIEEKPAKKLLRGWRGTRVWWGHGPNSELVFSEGKLPQILKPNIFLNKCHLKYKCFLYY